MPVSRDAVIWAYRFFLGREPESEAAIIAKMRYPDQDQLVAALWRCDEFRQRGRSDHLSSLLVEHPKLPQPAGIPMDDPALALIQISELPKSCFRGALASRIKGILTYPKGQEAGLSRLSVAYHGSKDPEALESVEIVLRSVPNAAIQISASHQRVVFGKNCSGLWVFHLWGACSVDIGDNTTSNGAECFLNDGGRLLIGDDCMIATTTLHVGDNHAIFDIASRRVLNYRPKPVIQIGSHTWLATGSRILADSEIGAGSIVGSGAIVKGSFAPCSLLVGSPARVSRGGVSWTRSYEGHGAGDVVNQLESIRAIPVAGDPTPPELTLLSARAEPSALSVHGDAARP